MACTDLFLVIKGRNNTPVFREGPRGVSQCPGSSTSPLLPTPACLARGSRELPAGLLLWESLYPCEGSIPWHLRRAALLHHLHPGVGSSICTSDLQKALGVLFYSKDVEAFQQRCSRSLPTYFEKYPASVEHLSVKGEEIPPCYYFLPIVLAWCGFGYYGFVK